MSPIPNSVTIDPPSVGLSGGRWMRLLSKEDFVRYLGAAIEATLVARGGQAGEARRLRVAVLRTFFARVQERSRRIRGVSKQEFLRQLERTHAELLGNRERLMAESEEVRSQLALARAGANGLDEEQERALDEALRRDLEPLLAPGVVPADLEKLFERERLRRRALVTRIVDENGRRIDVLERRLAKMRVELARMEDDLAELARRAAIDPGLASIYKSVQGLDSSAVDRERKSELLTCIFEENLALQRSEVHARDHCSLVSVLSGASPA